MLGNTHAVFRSPRRAPQLPDVSWAGFDGAVLCAGDCLVQNHAAHVSHNLNSLMRSFKGLYRELLQGFVRRLLGV